ncbi:PREDICTED: BTB/POZ and TAZ domain-containing protein 1-like isoform X1 [Populus euphratica]|uniref:BTB/POZ and TAZ domain-containing protein 1-like isoform X1 n=1 Tax=Populus euphratica TaxID=75702 RepID=A0AAJ6T2B0_POPEU|nr:PREDICTED: BTB/POZ and TAZ domain-containing protein 1-like isoform X1 [Populus euphratica]
MEETHNTATAATPTISGDLMSSHFQFSDHNSLPEPDVQILTSSGLRIPAHTGTLASVSPVLENIIDRPHKHHSSEKIIPILGVPCDAVSLFIQFLYSSRCSEEELEKYGIHLLALSHVYLVPQLKHICSKAVGQRLTVENVVDVLQLARLCDSPDLYVKCMKMLYDNFKAVEKTEGWKFMQENDPFLELEILKFIDEAESRKKRTRRQREEQRLFMELSEAMECLEHICTEGCTTVGPCDLGPSNKRRGPCNKFSTCEGLQLLIKHFALCKNRVNGKCSRCKRMGQLLRLHSSICDQTDSCRVPLCRQLKLKMQRERKGDETLWNLLVKKVASARVMSSLSLPKRKREEPRETIHDHGIRNFRK